MHVPFTRRAARQVTAREIREYDYVFLMDASNRTLLRRLVGTDADFWYTAFAADTLDGDFVSEASSVRGTGGALTLSVDADATRHPSRFVRVTVSAERCESAGVPLEAFLAR